MVNIPEKKFHWLQYKMADSERLRYVRLYLRPHP